MKNDNSNYGSYHHHHQHQPSLDSLCSHLCFKPCRCSCCHPLTSTLYQIRSWLSRPFNIPLIPHSFIPIIGYLLPGGGGGGGGSATATIKRITYGDLILNLPVFIFLIEAFRTCYWDDRPVTINESGGWATLAMWIAFWTANKSNAFSSFVYGISFDRMIWPHYWAGVVTLILGIFHGYIAFVRWGMPYHIKESSTSRSRRNFTNETSSVFTVFYSNNNNGGGGGETSNNTATWITLEPKLGTKYGQFPAASGDTDNNNNPNAFLFAFDGWVNWSGTYLTLGFLVLVLSSLVPSIRRKYYQLWFLSHILASFAVLYFGWIHFRISLLVVITWGLDLLIRYLVLGICRYPQEAQLTRITEDVTCLSWERTRCFEYNSGQFIKVAIPAINALEFHPFSVASAPHQDTTKVYIRGLGPWSRKVNGLGLLLRATVDDDDVAEQNDHNHLKMIKSCDDDAETPTTSTTIRVVLEGPYGCLPYHSVNPEVALFVCGGIAIAPCQSMALSLLKRYNDQYLSSKSASLRKLRFVWALREVELIDSVLEPELMDNPIIAIKQHKKNARVKNNNNNNYNYMSIASSCPSSTKTYDRLVETDIYLTRGSSSSSPENSPMSMVTETASIHCGKRPDLDAIVLRTRDEAIQEWDVHRVNVFCCGPTSLLTATREACNRYNNNHCCGGGGVTLDLHEEIFEF